MIRKGLMACEAYEQIVVCETEIQAIRIARYTDPPPLQNRARLNMRDTDLIGRAVARKTETRMSFMDSVLMEVLDAGTLSEDLAEALCYQQDVGSKAVLLTRAEVIGGGLRHRTGDSERDSSLAVLSLVDSMKETERHLQMLDFSCAVSEKNERIVRTIAGLLIQGPVCLLCSGMSYHAVGTQVVDAEKWVAMLGLAIQFGPIVDRTYVGHQLRQGFSALRISRGQQRPAPRVIAVL